MGSISNFTNYIFEFQISADIRKLKSDIPALRYTLNICGINNIRNLGNFLLNTLTSILDKSANFSLECPIKMEAGSFKQIVLPQIESIPGFLSITDPVQTVLTFHTKVKKQIQTLCNF